MSCDPPYADEYQPDFTPGTNKSPGAGDCAALTLEEWRSRLLAGDTFFRSKYTGQATNLISVEVVVDSTITGSFPYGQFIMRLNVYFDSSLVETYTAPQTNILFTGCTISAINTAGGFRDQVNASSDYIEMPTYDAGGNYGTGYDAFGSPAESCIDTFGPSYLTTGNGAPYPLEPSDTRTGPERDIYIVQTTELRHGLSDTGVALQPLPSEKIKQYDGTFWITYSNLVQGECPFDGEVGSP